MKIAFFGTPYFVVPILKALEETGYDVVAVVTQPDKPTGRKKLVTSSAVKIYAEKHNLPILQPAALKDDKFFEQFKNLNLDLAVVAGYGTIIPEKYLDIPKKDFLCVHPSLLPKYRGPSPIQSAMMNGDTESGATVIRLDKEMDHGPVVAIESCELPADASLSDVEKILWGLGTKLLIDAIPKYMSGEIVAREQEHQKATYTKLLSREDGKIDWSRPAQEIYNQIRALNPEPGTWTTWQGKILNIKAASVETSASQGKLVLVPTIVQLEGKKETPYKDFLSGYPDFKLSDCL